MILYGILISAITVMMLTGLFFWIICIFTESVKRPYFLFIGCLFWPFSIILIYIYLYFRNKIIKGNQ